MFANKKFNSPVMKKIFLFLFSLCLTSMFAQKNVEFEKDNFPGKKDEFKDARRNFKDGKELWDKGMEEYNFTLNQIISEVNMMPCSRREFLHAGAVNFEAAMPLLEKAQAFNPDNALLNWMLGFSKFHLKPQSDECIKYLEKSILLNPNVDIQGQQPYIMAWAYHLHSRWDDALKYYGIYKIWLNSNKGAPVQFEDVMKKIDECNTGKKLMAAPLRAFIDNMGPHINSPYPDYSAYVSTDEGTLIFTSRRKYKENQKKDEGDAGYFEDLYVSTKTNGEWSDAKNMGEPINEEQYHEATAGLSPDGTNLYIYEHHGKGGGDVFVSHLNGIAWSKPEKLNKNINSDYRETTVTESFDGKTLYFISNKPGGLGFGDIYMSTKDAKGNWGPAVNVGPPLNTKYAEEGLFMIPDGKTLYFSSKGPGSMGGYDIFKTVFENGKWGTPVNLGYPVNSPDDDVYFAISGSGRRGYYASAKEGGYGEKDIYVITFLGPEKPFALNGEDNLIASAQEAIKAKAAAAVEIKPVSLTILKGTITDAFTKKVLEASIELVDNVKNEVIATFKSNSSTGKYLVTLPSGKNYGIAVKAEGYLFHSENFDIPLATGYQEVIKDVELKNVAVGSIIVLRNIFFDFDKATLRPESTNELERLIKLLNDLPTLKIEISSHTDSKGSDSYNMTLSQARSESVVNYLISHGIAKDRLIAKGYGETKPMDTNDTDEGRQNNRRSEFKILSK
jgi:outer membrane protein OmpA-like peptidoglycan-associated protein/tetratricopeptide (TPR) repeat protein